MYGLTYLLVLHYIELERTRSHHSGDAFNSTMYCIEGCTERLSVVLQLLCLSCLQNALLQKECNQPSTAVFDAATTAGVSTTGAFTSRTTLQFLCELSASKYYKDKRYLYLKTFFPIDLKD